MILRVLCIFLLFPSLTLARMGGGLIGVEQSSCAGNVSLVSYTDAASSYNNMQLLGQSFTLASSKTVYAIRVNGTSTSGVGTLRLGTSANLASYTAEVASQSMAASGTTTFTFSSPVVLSSGTYYFGISTVSGTINLNFNTAGSYSGGDFYFTNSAGDWNMVINDTRDIWFEVLGCN